MSLLSDLLSKVKSPELRKDVPPGLKSTVSRLKKEEFNRRRMTVVIVFVVLAVGSGFAAVYIFKNFVPSKWPLVSVTPKTDYHSKPDSAPSKPDALPIESGSKKEDSGVAAPQKIKEETRQKKEEAKPSAKTYPTEKPPLPEKLNHRDDMAAKPKKPEAFKQEVKVKSETIEQSRQNAAREVPKIETPHAPVPGTKELYLYIAEDYERKKDFSNAISSYKKVIDIEPANYRVMNKIAFIMILAGLHEEALKYLKDALKNKQDYIPAMINSAIVYAKAGKHSEAEEYLLRVLSIEETNQTAMLNIALLYERQGRLEFARRYYSRLQKMGNAEGKPGMERIEALTGQSGR